MKIQILNQWHESYKGAIGQVERIEDYCKCSLCKQRLAGVEKMKKRYSVLAFHGTNKELSLYLQHLLEEAQRNGTIYAKQIHQKAA